MSAPDYHQLTPATVKYTAHQVGEKGRAVLALQHLGQVAQLLKLEKHQLALLAKSPRYDCFFLPKPKGGKRLIEAPREPLKGVQQRLGRWLQYAYFLHRSEAAFGFMLVPVDDPDPRHIYTNACRHLKAKWLLNIDLKDFFHQISQARVQQLFQTAPFALSEKAAACLAALCTYQGRLPMGAPTSPVVSNFACMGLDAELGQLAATHGWAYTRYADDLTFSGPEPFTETQWEEIHALISRAGFKMNTGKMRLRHRKDKPEVTGLILKKKPDVSPDFLAGIEQDLLVLEALASERMLIRDIFTRRPVKQLRRSIQGQLNFLKAIRGKDHKSCRRLQNRLDRSVIKLK